MGTRLLAVVLFAALSGCTTANVVANSSPAKTASVQPAALTAPAPVQTAEGGKHGTIDRLVSRYAAYYKVPVSLVHRVIKRESNYNPKAYRAGNYGLMQIRYRTAKGMGYDGSPRGLLNADTNLRYAVRYLKGAYIVADGSEKRADWLYQTGYYFTAKQKGLLQEAGWDGSRLAPAAYAPTDLASAATSIPMIGAVPLPQDPPAFLSAQSGASSQPLPGVTQIASAAQAATVMAASGGVQTPASAMAFTGSTATGTTAAITPVTSTDPVTPEKAPLPQDPPYIQ